MRASVFTLLLLAAAPAGADRVKVGETADTAYYVDTASIADAGDLRRVAVIYDYAKQEPGGIRSRIVSYEIDCAGERLRSIAVTEYPQPMAQGERSGRQARESEWLYVAPRTGSSIGARGPYRPILRFVCSR
jgi:hypothetical protein